MDIKVKVIKENKDGSADAIVRFDKEGLEFLVQEGLLAVLMQFIEQNKNAQAGVKMRKKLTTKKEKNES
jgi:hypothetical protein